MTDKELAAETARLRGWVKAGISWYVKDAEDEGRTGFHDPSYLPFGPPPSGEPWDPANRIEQAQELVGEIKKRGLLDEFTCYLVGRAEGSIGHRSEFPSDYFLWWFGSCQALEICRAFVTILGERAGRENDTGKMH